MSSKHRSSWMRRMLRLIGPGFITGASDDDPSGILTYAQTGAQFGYRHLWTPLLSLPFMIAIQEMCGRIGMVTGQGLAGVLRRHYPRPVLACAVALLLIANTVNIGADLGAMAASAVMLFGAPVWLWLCGMTAVSLLLEIFVPYKTYAAYLKYLILSLLAYVATLFLVEQDWVMLLRAAVVPAFSLEQSSLLNLVAVFGTTISPYLFFWQADEEVEEEIVHHRLREFGSGRPRVGAGDIRWMRMDTIMGMIVSNIIMFFVIATAASTLFPAGIHTIETASQAAQALRPLAGNAAAVLFAAGMIGTGLLAVPVLAGSASYALAESLGWREGLSKKLTQAYGFYGLMTVATIVGLFVNVIAIPPFRMLYIAAVLNGIVAPIMIACILVISNNRRIMQAHRNRWLSNILGGILLLFMAAVGMAAFFV